MNIFFKFDNLANFIAIFIGVFTVLAVIYGIGFMPRRKNIFLYHLYIILSAISSLAVVFTNNFMIFIIFWGFLGMLLYLLIGIEQNNQAAATAKKTFIIIGATDAIMILGIAIIWKLTGTFRMDKINLSLNNNLALGAYLCLCAGAFAKAGAMPFHTWVPDTAKDAPVPVTAYLPAALDKLLGIYFLTRLSLDIFEINNNIGMFLMVLGSLTIIAAVMMALVQHDFKRLLGYHAVSQVGYMILGIGTGNPIGIAGGLLHMLNNAIYKTSLFFGAGAVEKQTGTTDLDSLGGLAKFMPITFVSFLIASLAISGVPPFNGFVSKWMIYQGVIESGKNVGNLWIICLVAAMFGSALTLASFIKLIHAVFLGQASTIKHYARAPFTLWLPQVFLAVLCILFGVFARAIPLKLFIFPSLRETVVSSGIWTAPAATVLILTAIAIGFIIYLFGTVKTRTVNEFVGGEKIDEIPAMRLSGTEFYNTIQEMPCLRLIYRLAENKCFDIYEVGSRITFACNKTLRYLHNGILSTYLAWCLLGMIVLFYAASR